MTQAEIEEQALLVRQRTTMDAPPVPIERIVGMLGIRLQAADLGDDVSGLLVIEDGIPVIGYNRSHSKVRRRFTIAHECGHYILHKEESDLFVDDNFLAVYRSENSAKETSPREKEANAFAGALLMPEELLREKLDTHPVGLNLFNDKHWMELARDFQVSKQALIIRMSRLGFFGSV